MCGNGKDMTEDKDTEDHSVEVGNGMVLAVRSNVAVVVVDVVHQVDGVGQVCELDKVPWEFL